MTGLLLLIPGFTRTRHQIAEDKERQQRLDDATRIEEEARAILAKARVELIALGIELHRTTGFEVPDLPGLIDGHIHDFLGDSFGWARSEMSE